MLCGLCCSEKQRAQKIFKAHPPMDLVAARTKVMGFGMQLLDGIDPNPDNFVCAGIIHARAAQIGCLLRLEPNKQAQVTVLHFSSVFLCSLRNNTTNASLVLLSDVPPDCAVQQGNCVARNL